MKPLQVNYVQANGDYAILIYFKPHSDQISRLQALAAYIRDQAADGIIEVVPANGSLLLVFTQTVVINDQLMDAVKHACEQSLHTNLTPKLHEIPVCYHAELAPDLDDVLAHTGLTLDRLIKVHTAPTYVIDFLGFLPGFAYMNGLPERIRIARKSKPSQNTPAGSVAIANGQSGIYALNSPGGWHVIGRTPMQLINWQATHNIIYQPLDQIRFKAISYDQFISW
ncbi:MAG: 5-oxoprolinase subunit PxpB [Proteobacteria bacterium]|nr:5-oxoprolinase subunit PxpB [Pseudomonadota bacterium]